jgi:hypothetical protein
MVDICQVRPIASLACTETLGRRRRRPRVGHEVQSGVDAGLAQHLGRGVPVLLRADELVRLGVVAGGQLEVEVGDPEVAQQAEHEVEQVADLGRRLLGVT